MFQLDAVQAALKDFGFDAWLLYDFRGSNILARRILDLDGRPVGSRRFFYLIPAQGEPIKLVHRIETSALDHLPGAKQVYLQWGDLESKIAGLVSGRAKVAMEYSPRNGNPYVSKVDAGTVEVVKASGVEVVSSGDLVQLFEATWDDEQWALHKEAEAITTSAYDVAWSFIADRVRTSGSVLETEVQARIMRHFEENNLTTYSPPIVGEGPHSGDPHFETGSKTDTPIKEGSFVLIDLWGKMKKPRAVYSDLTRVGFVGTTVPDTYENIFRIVAASRDAAIAHVRDAFAAKRPLPGWEVDDAARKVIVDAGYGDFFVHRTGHNIGQETHGNGANMDNLETHEMRRVLPRTCFSIEPGIYQAEFGVRSEVNVYIDAGGGVHVTGGPLQMKVVPILA